MATKKEQITSKAIELIKLTPEGIRYSELVAKIQREFPDTPINTIHGTVWNLDVRVSTEVYKPARGLFRHTTFKDVEVAEEKPVIPLVSTKIKEEDFYEPFADWLVNELEECTKQFLWEEISLKINGEHLM